MTIMIPSCNAHAYMKFSKKNFAPYARNAMVKNIKTINKYNVGMKSLDRAIIVSDTLKTETSPSFIFQVRVRVPVPFPFPAPVPVPDSGFSIRPIRLDGFSLFVKLIENIEQPVIQCFKNLDRLPAILYSYFFHLYSKFLIRFNTETAGKHETRTKHKLLR